MKVDSVPVDTCANLTLVAAWETHKNHTNGKKDLKVGTFYLFILTSFWFMISFSSSMDRSQVLLSLGVQPHLLKQCACEVGRDLWHSEDLPDEEPVGGDGLVPRRKLQAEPGNQQVGTAQAEELFLCPSLYLSRVAGVWFWSVWQYLIFVLASKIMVYSLAKLDG